MSMMSRDELAGLSLNWDPRSLHRFLRSCATSRSIQGLLIKKGTIEKTAKEKLKFAGGSYKVMLQDIAADTPGFIRTMRKLEILKWIQDEDGHQVDQGQIDRLSSA